MKSFFPAITWAIFILVASVMKVPDLPEQIGKVNSLDKLAHAFVYFVLAGLISRGFHRQTKTLSHFAWYGAGISILFGIFMEVVQFGFFPYRHFELFDIMANIIGSFLSLFALKFFLK